MHIVPLYFKKALDISIEDLIKFCRVIGIDLSRFTDSLIFVKRWSSTWIMEEAAIIFLFEAH